MKLLVCSPLMAYLPLHRDINSPRDGVHCACLSALPSEKGFRWRCGEPQPQPLEAPIHASTVDTISMTILAFSQVLNYPGRAGLEVGGFCVGGGALVSKGTGPISPLQMGFVCLGCFVFSPNGMSLVSDSWILVAQWKRIFLRLSISRGLIWSLFKWAVVALQAKKSSLKASLILVLYPLKYMPLKIFFFLKYKMH